jgi:dCMP deaminase
MSDALSRPDWDTYFFGICRAVAARSIDSETKVGCVIANEKRRIVATGYNAFPAGVDDEFWPRDRETKAQVLKVSVSREYSGVPNALTSRNARGCYWVGKDKYYEVDKYMAMTHAEANAIVSAGQDLHECTLYTLLFPCNKCAQLIITAGIRHVVFEQTRETMEWAVAKELFIQASVELRGPERPEGER